MLKTIESSEWDTDNKLIWTFSHPDKLAPGYISSGWLVADVLCHPDEIINLISKSSGWLSYSQYLIRMIYGHCKMSSGWLAILAYIIRMRYRHLIPKSSGWLKAIGSITSGWLMDFAGCHPDDLRYWPMSSGWGNIIWSLSYPDDSCWQHLILRKHWRATAWCGKSKFSISSGWLKKGSVSHPHDMITLP